MKMSSNLFENPFQSLLRIDFEFLGLCAGSQMCALTQLQDDRNDAGDDVLVRQRDTLGIAGSAARVADRADVMWRGRHVGYVFFGAQRFDLGGCDWSIMVLSKNNSMMFMITMRFDH